MRDHQAASVSDNEVDSKDKEPGNDAVDELQASVMYSGRGTTKLRLYQALFDDRHQCDTEAEQ